MEPIIATTALPPLLHELTAESPDPASAAALFVEALTHRTFVNESGATGLSDNQRMELLGDAVLDLIVTFELYHALPHADEGLLSRARASIVNEAALAAGARAIDLGPSLRLGRGESASGGRERVRTLADALEAVIAAAHLSGGEPLATRVVHAALGAALEEAIAAAAPLAHPSTDIDARVKDPKSVLQEMVQRRGAPPPAYELEDALGPVHDRVFHVRVSAQGTHLGRGEGRSRRDAEMRAAAAALEAIRNDSALSAVVKGELRGDQKEERPNDPDGQQELPLSPSPDPGT